MNFLSKIILFINTIWLGLAPGVNQFTEGVIGQPRSFLPSQATTATDTTISRLIFRGLYKYDIYGSLIPDLAETVEISEDGLVYTITLKDNQYWSDGRKITSDDLIYTSFKVQNLSGVATDRVDDLKVRYTLPNKYSPFLSLLTVGVMPVDAEEDQNPLKPVSSGPFRVVRIERSGAVIKEVTLGHQDPHLDIRRLAFRFYANDEELLTAAKLGEISGFVSTKDHDLTNFSKIDYPIQGIYYALYFNLRDEKYKELLLRQNLAKVIPIEEIVYNRGISVQGPISRSSFTNRSLNFNYFDPKTDTLYEDMTFRITIPGTKPMRAVADLIANAWEDKYNAAVQIIEVDPEKINTEVIAPRNFEILLYGQEVGRDPDRYVNWHSTQKDNPGLNLSGFEQVRADRALEEGRNESDNNKRVVHYNEFQKVLVDEIPAVFLYHPFSKYYVSNYITGVGEKYTFTTGDRFLDFENWKKVETN